ncbi:MAG: LamG-like jellyroll fold domain-containing protein, partial [Planctomycetota bacterium]
MSSTGRAGRRSVVDGKGRPTLVARHGGKRYALTASEGIPADRWTRVRVEMDGSSAFIHIDGEEVAGKRFEFRPRMVFIGDRPEGNFIACGRNGDEFFEGRMDHFRIYRKVHDDFGALGPPPLALTQMQEWSEEDQRRSDEWEGRRKAKEAELKAGEYADILGEIRRLEQQKSALYKTAKLEELEGRVRDADNRKRALDRKISQAARSLGDAAGTEREVKELRRKIDGIVREIRRDGAYVKLTEEIRTCEKRRGEMERELRESPKLKAISAKTDAIGEEKRKAEERIRRLPELKGIMALSEQEKDGRKKRELQDRHRRLLEERKSADPAWQKAEVASQRLRRLRDETLRNVREAHAGRRRMNEQVRRLKQKLSALEARLRKSHPELSELEKSVRAKQEPAHTRRRQFEEKARAAEDYRKAEAARAAA